MKETDPDFGPSSSSYPQSCSSSSFLPSMPRVAHDSSVLRKVTNIGDPGSPSHRYRRSGLENDDGSSRGFQMASLQVISSLSTPISRRRSHRLPADERGEGNEEAQTVIRDEQNVSPYGNLPGWDQNPYVPWSLLVENSSRIEHAKHETYARVKAFRDLGLRRRQEEAGHFQETTGEDQERLREEREAFMQEVRQRRALELEAKMQQKKERLEKELARKEMDAARRKCKMEMQAKRRQEAGTIGQYVVLDSSLVTCRAGLEIFQVIPGFELCRMTMKNLPFDVKREDIRAIFSQKGISPVDYCVLDSKEVDGKTETGVLVNVEQRNTVLRTLDGVALCGRVISLHLNDSPSWTMGSMTKEPMLLTVSWKLPVQTLIAIYNTPAEAVQQARWLDGKTWKGQQISACWEQGHSRASSLGQVTDFRTVKLSGCRLGAERDPEFVQFVGTPSRFIIPDPTATTWHHTVIADVRKHLTKYAGAQTQSLEISTTGTGECLIRVEFEDWEGLKAAHASIDERSIGGGPILTATRPGHIQYSIKIPVQQYEAQKKLWDVLSKSDPITNAYVRAQTEDSHTVEIRLFGADPKTMGILKVRVENLVAGEQLGPEYWHSTFASENRSKNFFDYLRLATGTYAKGDAKALTLRIYGEPRVIEKAQVLIRSYVGRMAGIETRTTLDRDSVGFFVREGLGRLKELLGEDNVRFNLDSEVCTVTIKGGEEAKHHLRRLIGESKSQMQFEDELPGIVGRTCPICYDDVSNPEQLGCGHTYCSGCLKHFLHSATDTDKFPLVCMGEDGRCNAPISIPFLHRFLPPQVFQQLIEAAFRSYLQKLPQELKYCPTPDCKQIYRVRQDVNAMQCPSCMSTICPRCNEEGHEGMTCEERRIYKDPAEQERLNAELAAGRGYKRYVAFICAGSAWASLRMASTVTHALQLEIEGRSCWCGIDSSRLKVWS
ncbi:unnamed protein product [Cyclocybe aegerita]|uniref:RBR-type E3 ubiquitin transferase n=1 Tax=Cyclocybe aegerita TaxID=1973307 RepID=A0A8S0WBM7_CYCAE|nr:unnamed protein product [Cyclocybe aegerita]